ncbi:Kelch repeat-containing protein 3 [Exophiala sideris]|uniref:Kelch repeat-containing protein 3 n=1 Tax=Exophiala sideris TaxID=1016849 RepID=A0ABR0J0F0_9EURO|nr:Kelch repeat-containing protein 3 [Exophiala sideris]KAK5052169.1 Kelch repeat-containing protein 3 [Exophiala sideris]
MAKKKANKAEQKAQKQAKQTKKAAKGDKKNKAKAAALDDSDVDDVDLDAVLAAYAEEQAKYLKITEQACAPPGPRSSSTLVASPSNRNELFLFGGEFHDGNAASFYNDLFVYLIDRGEWHQVISGNSPLPRSGHAACRGGNTGGIYISGGEFSSPKQNQFYHYHDFWHLDTETREWTKLEPRGKGKSPPARSGHRMTYYKNYIVLFGGFQDTSQQTKYLNDLWIYDCKENVWHEMKNPPASQKPDPRSSFTFLPHESGTVLYGGYSRVKAASTSGKQGKGSGPLVRNVVKPVVHQDTWFLRITAPPAEAPSGTVPTLRWERRKKPANAPNPTRAGATMAFHKGRGVAFGGVHDVEESEEGIDSEFFNEMFIWNIDRNRFFPLTLRRPKTGAKKQVQPRGRDRAKADEEELLRNLAALETKGSGAAIEELKIDDIDDRDDEPLVTKKEFPVRFEMPHPRFNAQLTVQDDVLYMFGGTFEKKDVEITFSDLYAVDLGKLDGVKELYYVEPVNWNVTSQDSDEEMDEDEDDYEDSEMDTDEEDNETMSVDAPSTAPTEVIVPMVEAETAIETEPETSAEQDSRPFPRPFESLRDFYARTSEGWQKLVMESRTAKSSTSTEQSVKEIRKAAFEQAEERWWDCREEIRNLEDEQEAAGIGEVISMADRGTDTGGARRR